MYSKDDLQSKSISELEDIAKEIGAENKDGNTIDDLIYSILDRQAVVEGNKNPLGTKRKRVRIVKKDTDHVYSVNGKDGENFDMKKNKVPQEPPSLFKDLDLEIKPAEEPQPAEEPKPAPKRRGRKSKAQLEAEAAEAARLQAEAEAAAAVESQPAEEPCKPR